MAGDDNPQFKTHAQQYETVSFLGVARIEKLNRVLVVKSRARFLNRNAVLAGTRLFLASVPFDIPWSNTIWI